MRLEFSEAWCYELLRRVRWPNGITCPFCRRSRVTTHSKFAKVPRRRYLCLGCRRTFSDLKGTPFARTNLPLGTWFRCLRLLGGGRSSVELAKEIGVKYDTAVHMERRLAEGLGSSGLLRQLREIMERAENG